MKFCVPGDLVQMAGQEDSGCMFRSLLMAASSRGACADFIARGESCLRRLVDQTNGVCRIRE